LLFVLNTLFFIDSIYDLKFVSTIHPFIGILFAVSLLSFAGIPPLAGFFPKYFVILSLNEVGSFLIAIVLLVASSIAVFYYLDIIISSFKYKVAYAPIERISVLSFLLILISSLLNIFLVLYFPIINYWLLISLLDLIDPVFI